METNDDLSLNSYYEAKSRDENEFWDSVNNKNQTDPLWTKGIADPPPSSI